MCRCLDMAINIYWIKNPAKAAVWAHPPPRIFFFGKKSRGEEIYCEIESFVLSVMLHFSSQSAHSMFFNINTMVLCYVWSRLQLFFISFYTLHLRTISPLLPRMVVWFQLVTSRRSWEWLIAQLQKEKEWNHILLQINSCCVFIT